MTPASVETIDPVCGMTVDANGLHRFRHAGEIFSFCSERCRTVDLSAWLKERYRIPGENLEHTESSLANGGASDDEH